MLELSQALQNSIINIKKNLVEMALFNTETVDEIQQKNMETIKKTNTHKYK